MIDTWNSLSHSQSTMNVAINEWRYRFQACVNEKEDIMNTCYSKWTLTRTGCADQPNGVLDCAISTVFISPKL